jgi:predicted O-methyltransferase YrrM
VAGRRRGQHRRPRHDGGDVAAEDRDGAENFERGGLAQRITQLEGDAGTHLQQIGDGVFDLVFLDSKRSAYLDWWPALKRILRAGGLLVVDNATSHADEMADFTDAVRADAGFTTSLVPVGKGEFLAVKVNPGAALHRLAVLA